MIDSKELTFIIYGMDSLGQEKRDISRSMIIKQNTFITEVAVVPIFGVNKNEEAKFYEIFSNALYFFWRRTNKENTRRRKVSITNNYSK